MGQISETGWADRGSEPVSCFFSAENYGYLLFLAAFYRKVVILTEEIDIFPGNPPGFDRESSGKQSKNEKAQTAFRLSASRIHISAAVLCLPPGPCLPKGLPHHAVISPVSVLAALPPHWRDKVFLGFSFACTNAVQSISAYFTLIRSSFSSIGSAASHRNSTVAVAWTRSTGMPET